LAASDKQGASEKITALENHYNKYIDDLLQDVSLHTRAKEIMNEHFEFLRITQKISLSDALNKDILAQGELMSTKLFSLFLEQSKIDHALLPALDFMRLDQNEEPDLALIEEKLNEVLANHPNKNIFVTQGYICRNAKGEVDNLKRGGSDYTASLIAAAVKASVCEIWTDIDGMHNNDPRVVDKTVAIEQLSFDEAAELAYFGAKILHPTCIWPAQQENIPVKLLNTMQPTAAGTVIKKEAGTVGVKAVAAKDNIIAIKIKSSRMLLAYGFLRKIFEVFEKYKTPIDMITTSEVAVSVTIDSDLHLEEIIAELSNIASVEVEREQTIVSIVGNEIAKTDSILKKLFNSIDEIPITMVSYGGSAHNISLLIPSIHKTKKLKLINKGLFNL
jgi:aspartate kinase